MGGKSGPGVPKNLRKVKPGYDQEFTLPKGTSAAPIKQVTGKGAKGSVWSRVTKKDAKKYILQPAIEKTPALKLMYPEGMKTVKGDAIKAVIPATVGAGVISQLQGNRNEKRPKKHPNPRKRK
tara:strand:- start:254 stop:622 length:369 start_codon:yes stop_codon:yes gene_type:complete